MPITKGKTTHNSTGFTTTHYWKNQPVGTSSFKMNEHFGWIFNADGSVTIAANRVAFNKYGLGRGMMESLTNCYSSAKKYGLETVIAMFADRLQELYKGVTHATRKKTEKENFIYL